MTMNRWVLVSGLLLVGTEAAAQAIEPGGVNVRFEQVQNKLTIRAQIYLNDGDRVVETSDLPLSQRVSREAEWRHPSECVHDRYRLRL